MLSCSRAADLAPNEVGHPVKKSTVQSICNMHRKRLASKRLDPQVVAELPLKKRG